MSVQGISHARNPAGQGRSEWSDEALAGAVRGGDREAYAELYRRYADRVKGYVVNRVDDRAWHEDLAAEVLMEALARLRAPAGDPDAYRDSGGPASFGSWLFGAVARTVVRRGTWARWEERQALRELALELSRPSREGGGALRGDLAEALAAVPADRRRVVELRYLEGQSVETTARVLGISEAKVSRFAREGLAALGRTGGPDPGRRRIFPQPGGRWRGYVLVTGEDGRRREQWFSAPTWEQARDRWDELAAGESCRAAPVPAPREPRRGVVQGSEEARGLLAARVGGRAVVDARQVAAALDVDPKTARRMLAALEAQGRARRVPRERGPSRAHRYQLELGQAGAAPDPRAAPARVPAPRAPGPGPAARPAREPSRRRAREREPELALAGIAPPARGRGGRSR
jgi:RNA polymerase sigma factor (sigma-70 family)